MKKYIALLMALLMVLSLSACGKIEEEKVYEGTASYDKNDDSIGDIVDLTKLSSTMVYSEVNQIMITPEKYIGKTIKMAGKCALYYNQQDESKTYYSCIISDATACCSQGIEFTLKEGDAYPDLNTDITVEGTFVSYKEDGTTYYHLENAKLL